jgi:hypothetical protein
MPFKLKWTPRGRDDYQRLRTAAEAGRKAKGRDKSSKAEGLFKQVVKSINHLTTTPKHPGLNTHEYDSLDHPYKKGEKVWEAYVQNQAPGAYRLFWCYGPETGEITVIAITPHP